jgi:hypothetical protein
MVYVRFFCREITVYTVMYSLQVYTVLANSKHLILRTPHDVPY